MSPACWFGPGWGVHRTQDSRALGALLRIQLCKPSRHQLSLFGKAVTGRQEPWAVPGIRLGQAENPGAPWPRFCQPLSGPRSYSTLRPLVLPLGSQSARTACGFLSCWKSVSLGIPGPKAPWGWVHSASWKQNRLVTLFFSTSECACVGVIVFCIYVFACVFVCACLFACVSVCGVCMCYCAFVRVCVGWRALGGHLTLSHTSCCLSCQTKLRLACEQLSLPRSVRNKTGTDACPGSRAKAVRT